MGNGCVLSFFFILLLYIVSNGYTSNAYLMWYFVGNLNKLSVYLWNFNYNCFENLFGMGFTWTLYSFYINFPFFFNEKYLRQVATCVWRYLNIIPLKFNYSWMVNGNNWSIAHIWIWFKIDKYHMMMNIEYWTVSSHTYLVITNNKVWYTV